MKTILFVVGPALGHVGRSLVIARAVLESTPGARIVFAHIVPGYGDRLLGPEFDCIRIHHRGRGDESFADGLEQAIRSVDPALICLDMSPVPWLYLVRFPEIPRASITNFFLTALVGEETFQDRQLSDNFMEWNDRRFRRDLPELRHAKTLYDADAVLLCDPVALVSSDISIMDPYHVVGPCIWQPAGTLPQRLSGTRRLLLISLGSTGSRLLPAGVVQRLQSTLGCEASVWLTADRPAGEPQESRLVYSGIPIGPILQRSALAITQGGAGSTYAALLQGVPVAVWPSHRNHELLGEVLTRAGVGSLVTELVNLEPVEIRTKVANMESESGRLRRASCGVSGPAKAAEILLSLI